MRQHTHTLRVHPAVVEHAIKWLCTYHGDVATWDQVEGDEYTTFKAAESICNQLGAFVDGWRARDTVEPLASRRFK